MVAVACRQVVKSFGATQVLRSVDIDIPDGTFAVLVGPSGCGKSTLLRLLAGLEELTSGTIHFGDRDVTRAEPRERDIAMVFQSYALYPHLSVRDNLAFGLKLRRTDGSMHEIGPNDPLYAATIGGLGLTGVIEWVEFQAVRIRSAFLDAEDVTFDNVDAYFELAAERKDAAEHAMAWVDCLAGGAHLGRGVFSFANWSRTGWREPHREHPSKEMPFDAPGFALNPLSVGAFNTLYNGLKSMRAGKSHVHYEPFLYPLDAIAKWNRLYGSKGFYQYQSVVPPGTAREAVREQLKLIAKSGQGSFLAVLKDMGPIPSLGMLSFPTAGTTLALDFPNKGARTLKLMGDLDRIVLEAGGRLYPAKDGRIPAEMFRAGFPQWQGFRDHVDPGLSSGFWKRVSA